MICATMSKNLFVCALIGLALTAAAQEPATPSNRQGRSEPREHLGDAPEPYPLAKDLSAGLNRHDIEKAMKKVADWQLPRVREHLDTDWTFAVLEIGLVTASDTLHDPKYRNAVKDMAEKNAWQLGPRLAHADDHVVGQSFLRIYEL